MSTSRDAPFARVVVEVAVRDGTAICPRGAVGFDPRDAEGREAGTYERDGRRWCPLQFGERVVTARIGRARVSFDALAVDDEPA